MDSLPLPLVHLVDSFIEDVKDKATFRRTNKHYYIVLYKLIKPEKESVTVDQGYSVINGEPIETNVTILIEGRMVIKIFMPPGYTKLSREDNGRILFESDSGNYCTQQSISDKQIRSMTYMCDEFIGTIVEPNVKQLAEINTIMAGHYKHWPTKTD